MDSNERSFLHRPHLSKKQRLPRSYKEVEKILRNVKACRGTVKTLLNNSRLRGSAFKKVYALSVNVLRKRPLVDKIIKDTQLLERERFLREDLAEILVYELIFGKGLPGESRPVNAVKNYRLKLHDAYQDTIKSDSFSFKDPSTIPRYVRVNTLRITVSKVINNFTNAHYKHIQYGKETSEAEYLDLIRNLKPCNFLLDYHFKDLLVFSPYEKVQNWVMFKKNLIYIQDKSSYLPVFALDPKPGSTVLDACAAPGMKTIHIATIMENKGKIHAIERNSDRFKILKDMLNRAPVKIYEAQCMDFYSIDPNNPKYNSVEYILVDPSCSGSGMVNRLDPVTTKISTDVYRLEKLAGFQILLLKHALSFPSVNRVVYSTCSLSEEENEYVVHEVLQSFKHIFKLVPAIPDWSLRGIDKYKFGKFCLRADPQKTLTNGFFVAMFERMTSEEIQELTKDESFFKDKWSRKKKKINENWWPKDDYNDSDVRSEAFGSSSTSDLDNSASTLNNDSSSSHSSLKKRKQARVIRQSRQIIDSSEMSNQTNCQSSVSIITSENNSSDCSVKPTSVFNKIAEEGHCSRENIHPNELLNNASEKNKQKEIISKNEGNVDDYTSKKEDCSPESSKPASSEEKINNCSSHNSDKLFQKKKKQQNHSFVKEHSGCKIQNECLGYNMNIPEVEGNSNISNDNSYASKKRKKYSYAQDKTKQNLSDDNMDSKVTANHLNKSCFKTDFTHNLGQVENSTNQYKSNKIKANKKEKKIGVKNMFDSLTSGSEQTFEPQNTPEKKHYLSTENARTEERLSGTVFSTEQTLKLQEAYVKKQKKKHTSTEFGETVSYTEPIVESQGTPEKKCKKKHYTSSDSIKSEENVSKTVSGTEQIVETQGVPGKKRKRKHNTSPKSTKSGDSESYIEHTDETQDVPRKKHKKKHYTITESTEPTENVNETVSCIVKTELKKKHKKKCKDKKTKEE